MTHHNEHPKEHHIATARDMKINKILWTVMLCSLVASVTIVILQLGLINDLVARLGEPARPAQVIRLSTPLSGDLICTLQPGSPNDAPNYKCVKG